MSTVNKTMHLGRLTRDPEVKYLPSGKTVATFDIAFDKFEGGEKKPVFVTVKAWEKLADVAEKYLHKGDPVHIEGRLDMEQWADRTTGQQRTKHVIIAERITLLGKGDGQQVQKSQPRPAPQAQSHGGSDATDDDLPF
jgi:single-strand DNA-binding protein